MFVPNMKSNFVVGSVYCCFLVDEVPTLQEISALDIWLVYLLMFVAFAEQLNDALMAVKRILLKDLVVCLVNNHCLYHPANCNRIIFSKFFHSFIMTKSFDLPNHFRRQLHQMHCPIAIFRFLGRLRFSMIKKNIFNFCQNFYSMVKQLTEDSDLFFKIDLDRRCDSIFDAPSEESCDNDLSGDLPIKKKPH